MDIDGDSDVDLVVGAKDGKIYLFENNGSNVNPMFAQVASNFNIFKGIDVGENSAPLFGDLDKDNDYDLLVLEKGDNTNFFENTGTFQNPRFTHAAVT